MAANTNPIFALTPETKIVEISAVTTDKTGATTTNLVELVTGATNGTKIAEIGYKAQGETVAGLFLIFITDTSGANPKLLQEIDITAITGSNTVENANGYISFGELQLKSGQKILVGITTISGTDKINAFAKIGDF